MWGFIPLIERKRRQENKELVWAKSINFVIFMIEYENEDKW
jgi:hypothetical protein